MALITYADKSPLPGSTLPEHNISHTDMNDLKNGVNAKFAFENPVHFSDIDISAEPRLIIVEMDETNNNDRVLYLHNGIQPIFLLTLQPI